MGWPFDVRAQVSEQMPVPEQWQLTLDGIKSKAQALMIENNGLQNEYQQLTGQVQKLQQLIHDQQYKNDQMDHFLKERHGRTDQQLRIEGLTQMVKTKRQEARTFEEQLRSLKKKQLDQDNKIQKAQRSQNTGLPRVGDQLSQWRKLLENENRQEVLLENELKVLKTADKTQNFNEDAIELQNKKLEARLGILQSQKLRHIKKYSNTQLAQDNVRMYDQLKKRKDELEANIGVYESRMDELRESSLMAMSWTLKRKKLIHDMVQTDARNNKMRDKIKVLREDIDVLKDQVIKLERRVNFVKEQAAKQ